MMGKPARPLRAVLIQWSPTAWDFGHYILLGCISGVRDQIDVDLSRQDRSPGMTSWHHLNARRLPATFSDEAQRRCVH